MSPTLKLFPSEANSPPRTATPKKLEEEPILILDIKLIKDKPEKIIVMENDEPEEIVERFCGEHTIDQSKKTRLLNVIK